MVSVETAMSSGGPPLLNGRVSRELKATVATKGDKSHMSAIKLLSDFFTVIPSAISFSLILLPCLVPLHETNTLLYYMKLLKLWVSCIDYQIADADFRYLKRILLLQRLLRQEISLGK